MYKDIYGENEMAHKVCRVAYTLDNVQPVICTYVGDQPFFYMDYEDDIIEDEDEIDYSLFDDKELGMLAKEINSLKREVEMLDVMPFHFTENSEKLLNAFYENAESIAYGQESDSRLQIGKAIEILQQSRLGTAYLNMAEKHNVSIEFSAQIEHGFYDRKNAKILINPNLEVVDQVLLLSKELRRHWQHRQGVLIHPLMFQPENAVLVNRAQQADLAVSVVRIAWELQLAGIKAVWERVENSPLADLARAFAREAFIDFRTINNGVATAAVFETWFLSERCRLEDKKIIQAMLADYKGYVFENMSASQNVTIDLIAGLGEMPFGKNYLAAHANTIMTDPIFTEVRDRSNANFLWFIKFERSFKQTEQHLQTESDLSTHDIRHDLYNKKGQDQNYAISQSADIVQFKQYAEQSGKQKRVFAKHVKHGGADVIDIRSRSPRRI